MLNIEKNMVSTLQNIQALLNGGIMGGNGLQV